MARIILTGASGFIGSHILARLLADGHTVLAPIRRKQIPWTTKSTHVMALKGLFYDKDLLSRYKEFSPDIIIHAAAVRGAGRGSWSSYRKTNVEGTDVLIDFALHHSVKQFIYISTVGVFGTIPERMPADTWAPPAPDNYYHRSKYQAELLITKKLIPDVKAVILRPTITYGVGDRGFVFKLIKRTKAHLLPTPSAHQKIHLLSVRFLVEVISRIIEFPPEKSLEIFNVADKSPISLLDLMDFIHEHFYGKKYPRFLRVPKFGVSLLHTTAQSLGWQSMLAKIQLLTQSWMYDVTHLHKQLELELPDTFEEIKRYLQLNFSPKHHSLEEKLISTHSQ